MWTEIIYWIGVLCCVWCVYDLFTTRFELGVWWKLLLAVGIIAFSWIGIAAYWLFIRARLK